MCIVGVFLIINKHAFCIIAHKDVEQINILLHILVHLKIDIYLHIDLKSSIAPSDFKYSVCADELYKQMLLWWQIPLHEKGKIAI